MNKYQLNEDIRAAVVGAGVAGLSTASQLQEALPGIQVDIIADKFLTETCSDGAAGLYRPTLDYQIGPTLQTTRKVLRSSFAHFNRMLINSPNDCKDAGVMRTQGFLLSFSRPSLVQNPMLEELPGFRPCSSAEINSFGGSHKYGSFLPSVLAECRKYLPYLTHKIEYFGGQVIIRKLDSFEELAGEYDIVFNCTGLGAQHLCNDNTVIPIRGQVFKVKAPWIRNFVFSDSNTYIIPGTELVTLGGTRNFASYDTELDKYDSASIWERATNIVPSLKRAKVEREWVGLRPYRPVVRIEKEELTFQDGKTMKMIHNYGHGAFGVMVSPGCAEYAVELGLQVLGRKKSKL